MSYHYDPTTQETALALKVRALVHRHLPELPKGQLHTIANCVLTAAVATRSPPVAERSALFWRTFEWNFVKRVSSDPGLYTAAAIESPASVVAAKRARFEGGAPMDLDDPTVVATCAELGIPLSFVAIRAYLGGLVAA